MIVITLTDCPLSLRGDLTKWLVEINTGVFVGRVSARVRDNLWLRVTQNVKNGRATMVYNTNNEQHMDFRLHNSENEIIDFDGLKLVLKPSPARMQRLAEKRILRTGFSKASKMRLAKRMQNGKIGGSISYPDDYVVLDVETTGLNPDSDEIIEIGLLKICDNKITDEFNALVKIKNKLPKKIINLTGITEKVLTDEGRELGDVLADVRKFIGNSVIVGHNVEFDIGFLNSACKSCGYKAVGNNYYDTLKMYAKILKGRKVGKKLIDIASVLGIQVNENHRSLADCHTTKSVYDALKTKLCKNESE